MSTFAWHVLLSFISGGLWVTLATVAAQHAGPRVGGWMAGLPSVMVISFTFIGLTGGLEQAIQVTTLFPVTFAANGLFLVAFCAWAKTRLPTAMGRALGAWLIPQVLVLLVMPNNFALSTALWLVITSVTWPVVLKLSRHNGPEPGSPTAPLHMPLLYRALLAGSIVAGAVIASRLGGPVWVAVFSSFPAVFTSTLLLSTRAFGRTFTRTLIPGLHLSALVNCMAFAVLFRYGAPHLGLAGALIAAYAGTMLPAFLTHRILSHIQV